MKLTWFQLARQMFAVHKLLLHSMKKDLHGTRTTMTRTMEKQVKKNSNLVRENKL